MPRINLGFAAPAPDFQLHWSGESSQLRIFFNADGDSGDTTLLINLPDGGWICGDDAYDGTLNPMVVIDDPPVGRFDIWVGSYYEGQSVSGTLSLTERQRGP